MNHVHVLGFIQFFHNDHLRVYFSRILHRPAPDSPQLIQAVFMSFGNSIRAMSRLPTKFSANFASILRHAKDALDAYEEKTVRVKRFTIHASTFCIRGTAQHILQALEFWAPEIEWRVNFGRAEAKA
jgi:hypothetical protein